MENSCLPVHFEASGPMEESLEVVVCHAYDLEVLMVEEVLEKLVGWLISHLIQVIKLGLNRALEHEVPQRSGGWARVRRLPPVLIIPPLPRQEPRQSTPMKRCTSP